MSARDVHKIELAVRRVINANLDDSIDEMQLRHIIARALGRHVPEPDIVRGLREAQVNGIDGEPIERYVHSLALSFGPRDLH